VETQLLGFGYESWSVGPMMRFLFCCISIFLGQVIGKNISSQYSNYWYLKDKGSSNWVVFVAEVQPRRAQLKKLESTIQEAEQERQAQLKVQKPR